MLNLARYTVLVGNYGSGKTEIALNLALRARRERGEPVTLVDLDIVNPYFRSAEQRAALEREGVRVLMPAFALSTVDIPVLPADIMRVFDDPQGWVVFDVGGDDTGAAALGRYAAPFARVRGDVSVLYVVNPFRPLSRTAEDVRAMFSAISSRARLTPDALVDNANVGRATTPDDLRAGRAFIARVAEAVGLPVAFHACDERLIPRLTQEEAADCLPLHLMTRPAWLDEAEP